MVQRRAAPKTYMTVTAFRGCLFSSTWPIQEERGRTPSRATAKIRREAATTATLVPCVRQSQSSYIKRDGKELTKIKPNDAMMVMKILGPLPNAIAYIWTKGWGASRVKRVSKSGVQNKKRIVVMNPMIPVAKALVNIPRPATTLRSDVNERYGEVGKNSAYLALRVSSAM